MPSAIDNLWHVARRSGVVDAMTLFRSVAAAEGELATADVRSRMLIRDAISALQSHFGPEAFARHARRLNFRALDPQVPADSGDGFPTLRESLVDATNPESLTQLLRDLGSRVRQPSSIIVGGALALMLDGLLVRQTEDVDLVDELPDAFRSEHELLDELRRRYRLQLTHFQSHYLPENWRDRIRSLGQFGSVRAFAVDSLDILTCKLFSSRLKDFDDIRQAWPLIDRAAFADRVRRTTRAWRQDKRMHAAAQRNWYILTGDESLPA